MFAIIAGIKPRMRYIFRYFFLIKRFKLKLMKKSGLQELPVFGDAFNAGVIWQIQWAETNKISTAPANFFQTGFFRKSEIKSELAVCVSFGFLQPDIQVGLGFDFHPAFYDTSQNAVFEPLSKIPYQKQTLCQIIGTGHTHHTPRHHKRWMRPLAA